MYPDKTHGHATSQYAILRYNGCAIQKTYAVPNQIITVYYRGGWYGADTDSNPSLETLRRESREVSRWGVLLQETREKHPSSSILGRIGCLGPHSPN
eukprot:3102532-Prymnesium_polylepis.1